MKQKYLKYRFYFLISLVIVGMGACNKDLNLLDVPPKGSLTDETTFSSEGNADLFVNDIYNQLPDLNGEDQVSDQYADNSACGASWMNGESLIRKASLNPSNVPTGPASLWDWEKNYTNIRKCNVFLAEVENYKANFTEAWIIKRSAEVKFLRAFWYSILYTSYGGVPIIDSVLNVSTQDSAIFYPRSTLAQTLGAIESDCDAAAADLPSTPEQTGRATQGAALALKGWVDLFAASPLVNTTNDLTAWSKAATANKAVMDLGVFSLFTKDGVNSYSTQFLSKNNWNPETIFARGYALPNNGSRREGMLGPTMVNGTEEAWGNLAPTQSLVDDYAMDNGLPITDPGSGYDSQHPYDHREPRFYQSIVYDGSYWQGYQITTRIGGNNEIDLGRTSDITNTGYYGRKTLDSTINGQVSINIHPGTNNFIFFRYAEVLLSYAEAQNEAHGPDGTVYDAVNSVRERSGCPDLPLGLDQNAIRSYIRRERRIELAFEEKRWFDIRRWLITTGPNGVLTTDEIGMKITGAPPNLVYSRVTLLTNLFYPYQNWLPIPQADMDKNKKLVQNPGY